MFSRTTEEQNPNKGDSIQIRHLSCDCHWVDTPRGRLALGVALDQFPRSLWRDTPAAFGQDIKACRFSMTVLQSGECATLEPWEEIFHLIAVSNCEGPDHLERMDFLIPQAAQIVARLESPLEDMAGAS